MEMIHLQYQTGDKRADQALRGVIGFMEAAFPGRVRGYFLAGSYADGSAVATSDLDIRVVFKENFLGEAEIERFLQARRAAGQLSPLAIDCPPLDEARLREDENWLHEAVTIRLASHFVYGEDIRRLLPLPPLDAYVRNAASAVQLFMARLHGQETLPEPICYPDPAGEFFGYDRPDPDTGERSLKMLVHVAGFIATYRVGREAGRMVVKKSDWLPAYRETIHDAWSTLLGSLWEQCKLSWQYRVPLRAEERARLRAWCEEFLLFEKDYLTRYAGGEG